MSGKQQEKKQPLVEPGNATVRQGIPIPFPIGTLPVKPTEIPSSTSEGRLTSRFSDGNHVPVLRGLYIISVAARLLNMHPQTLRKYERVGLIRPSRTIGMLRLYSQQDIARLKLIKHLVDGLGLNLAGAEFVLGLLRRLWEVQERIVAIEEQRLKDILGRDFEELLDVVDLAFSASE